MYYKVSLIFIEVLGEMSLDCFYKISHHLQIQTLIKREVLNLFKLYINSKGGEGEDFLSFK